MEYIQGKVLFEWMEEFMKELSRNEKEDEEA